MNRSRASNPFLDELIGKIFFDTKQSKGHPHILGGCLISGGTGRVYIHLSKISFPPTTAKQLLSPSVIRNASGGLIVIGNFKKYKIDSKSSSVPKQGNCELKKVPSNCTNWCLAWRKTNWAIRETIHRPREKLASLPFTDTQCISMEGSIPSRTFLRRKTLTGKSCWGSKPVAVAASFSGLVILFLWLTPRDGTKAWVHHCKQDWQ